LLNALPITEYFLADANEPDAFPPQANGTVTANFPDETAGMMPEVN
jgi:hypothetical protein